MTPSFNSASTHTSCQKCVFALREGGDGTQYGCALGRTDVFREQGSLVDVYDAGGDEFYVVADRICLAHREEDSEWARRHPTDRLRAVKEEIALRLSLLVLLEEGTTESALDATCASVKAQSRPFHEAHFLNHQTTLSPGRLNAALMARLGNAVTWRITGVIAEVDTAEATDLAVSRLTGQFYAVFRPGFVIPTDFVESLHQAIVERLERFSLLTPLADGNGLVVQTSLHRNPRVDGNRPATLTGPDGSVTVLGSLVEKVALLAEAADQRHMVRPVVEVVPSLNAGTNP